ncbi:UNVERIFIED_CONTAM: hypothetical protein Sradi_0597400 [Sesamum radiatum]|uniref:Zinc finger, CCHC-type n=1 Tax=Sesamum radiatum TaxID=300843 RepID=A0AAW2VIT3_SESRA
MVVQPHVAQPVAAQGERPEKFSGTEFKRWHQKMLFYLTTLNLARFLSEEAPVVSEGGTDTQERAAMDAWLSQDCKSSLGVLEKEIQDRGCWLEEIHSRKVFGIQNGGFSKTVMNQVQEFQMILHDLHVEGMTLSESFQVAAMIEKLPPLWKDFKNYLKHKRKEMGLEDLIVRLRIEEDNRLSEMKSGRLQIEAKANLME